MTTKTESPIEGKKPGRPAKMMKVAVRNMSAFTANNPPGSTMNVWGNEFTVRENGSLVAEIPRHLAEEGFKVGRYMPVE